MRIGSGNAGGGGGYGSPNHRQNAFRSRHRPGDIITGRVLRRHTEELFWVAFGSDELLAALPETTLPGQLYRFEITALSPEITLRVVPGGHQGQTALVALIHSFMATRDQFDALAIPLFNKDKPAFLKASAYLEVLCQSPEALICHARLQQLAKTLGDSITMQFGYSFFFLPRLLPHANRQALLRRMISPNQYEFTWEFSTPESGDCSITSQFRGSDVRFRASFSDPAGEAFSERLETAAREAKEEVFLGATKRSPSSPGILQSLAAMQAQQGGGLISSRV